MVWVEGPPKKDCNLKLIEVPEWMRPVANDESPAEVWNRQVTSKNAQIGISLTPENTLTKENKSPSL
jgi:hypothetical protein